MSKQKFTFDPLTLEYVPVKRNRFKEILLFLVSALFFMGLGFLILPHYFDTPDEKALRRETAELKTHIQYLDDKYNQLEEVLAGIRQRDKNLYRLLFEADPIPDEVRQAGFGGADFYEMLRHSDNETILTNLYKKADILSKQMVVQSKSFDELVKLAREKEEYLAHVPAIQPIQNKDLKRIASGFGRRFHPILKIWRPHNGMDFTASTGTPVYATGDGTVYYAGRGNGFGIHIKIDHGFGYQTVYAHLSKMTVKKGDKVKRGQIIGYSGNTGLSAGPHLHYEVHYKGKPVNPVYYFYRDLDAADYEKLLELASQAQQSLD
ncbi:MAG: M23 family metallopeptidase [Chlorobi bacterium]|nr:M23 family metallopeptidase [Chlorobiota bacterium]